MKYKVLVDFKDLQDAGYQYKAGDVYPHTGEATAARAKQLMTPTLMRGALIAEDAEPVEKQDRKRKKT